MWDQKSCGHTRWSYPVVLSVNPVTGVGEGDVLAANEAQDAWGSVRIAPYTPAKPMRANHARVGTESAPRCWRPQQVGYGAIRQRMAM